jgi:nondiscriminating aspartyl-tRNA synthetase
MRTLVADLGGAVGSTVTVAGWVHRVRDLGRVCFVVLRDRSGTGQLVFESNPGATLESVVRATGMVAANDKAPGGAELRVQSMEVLSAAAADLPIAVNQEPGKLSLEAILDHRMLSVRNPQILSIFRVQATILKTFAEHLRGEGFTEIKTSKLIGTGTEGGTGLFAVDYFDTKMYLTQSPQLYKQAMVASGLERVFEIGPAYRAEKHDTPRHINEVVSLDVEAAFVDGEQELERRGPGSVEGRRARPGPCGEDSAREPRRGARDRHEGDGQEDLGDRARGRARPVRLGSA